MSHTMHPSIKTHGLADGCPRCEFHAECILSLDDSNLFVLWKRVITDDDDARSRAERRAMDRIAEARRIMQHIAEVERIQLIDDSS